MLHHSPAHLALQGFQVIDASTSPHLRRRVVESVAAHQLQALGQATKNSLTKQTAQRYQQFYHGVPVLGGQVIAHHKLPARQQRVRREIKKIAGDETHISGVLYRDIKIDRTQLTSLAQPANITQAIDSVKQQLTRSFHSSKSITFSKATAKLALLPERMLSGQTQLQPVIAVCLWVQRSGQHPIVMRVIVDAKKFNRIKRVSTSIKRLGYQDFNDTGPGGNRLTGKYVYGKNQLPYLPVRKKALSCYMENALVRAIDLTGHQTIDEEFGVLLSDYMTPYQYRCSAPWRDVLAGAPGFENGAYAPVDDAFFFGELVTELYQDWLQVSPLVDQHNDAEQLRLRVHVLDQDYFPGEATSNDNPHYFANAFWDSSTRTMNFGDGDANYFYPLISPVIVGHEVSHGFTEDHSDLDYGADQPGSLNEAYSDIAGIAAKSFLLEKYPKLYQAIYHKTDLTVADWEIGTVVVKSKQLGYFRDMAHPAEDGESADCLDARVATEICQRTYAKVGHDADKLVADIDDDIFAQMARSDYIVHADSGIFNHFAYWLSQQPGWTVKKVFVLFATANADYWQSETGYQEAVTGLLQAAKDLSWSAQDQETIKQAARAVGIAV